MAQMDEKMREKFEKAAIDFGLKTDLDPLAIEQAYEGRERLLLARAERKDGYLGGAVFTGMLGGMGAGLTALSIADEAGKYGDNGPVNNIAVGAPIVLLLAGVAFFMGRKCKAVNQTVKRDVEKYAGNQQPLLPVPQERKQLPPPKLI
jgi:hypothetical protein